jgi:hypothetical protein
LKYKKKELKDSEKTAFSPPQKVYEVSPKHEDHKKNKRKAKEEEKEELKQKRNFR